jgi:hypothetical protein
MSPVALRFVSFFIAVAFVTAASLPILNQAALIVA